MALNVTGKSSDRSFVAGAPSGSSSSSSSASSKSANGQPGATPWPALIPLGHHQGKPPIPLMRPVTLVGSRQNAHLHLLSRQISKAHALILSHEGKVYVRDLASRTHVYINGQETREADLNDGDIIKLGSFTFRFQAAAGMKQKPRPDDTPPGQLDVDGADFPLQIDQRVMLIGRRPTCDISLVEDSCSTAHAAIFSMGGKHHIRDLGSRTGTYINGQLTRKGELQFGDEIRIGETMLRYQESPVPDAEGEEHAATVDEFEDLVGTAPLVGSGGQSAASAGATIEPLDVEQVEPLPAAVVPSKNDARDPLHVSEADFSPEDLELDIGEEPAGVAATPHDTALIPLAEASAPHKPTAADEPIPVVTEDVVDARLAEEMREAREVVEPPFAQAPETQEAFDLPPMLGEGSAQVGEAVVASEPAVGAEPLTAEQVEAPALAQIPAEEPAPEELPVEELPVEELPIQETVPERAPVEEEVVAEAEAPSAEAPAEHEPARIEEESVAPVDAEEMYAETQATAPEAEPPFEVPETAAEEIATEEILEEIPGAQPESEEAEPEPAAPVQTTSEPATVTAPREDDWLAPLTDEELFGTTGSAEPSSSARPQPVGAAPGANTSDELEIQPLPESEAAPPRPPPPSETGGKRGRLGFGKPRAEMATPAEDAAARATAEAPSADPFAAPQVVEEPFEFSELSKPTAEAEPREAPAPAEGHAAEEPTAAPRSTGEQEAPPAPQPFAVSEAPAERVPVEARYGAATMMSEVGTTVAGEPAADDTTQSSAVSDEDLAEQQVAEALGEIPAEPVADGGAEAPEAPEELYFGDEPIEQVADAPRAHEDADVIGVGAGIEHIEVVEPTEPTSESALPLDVEAASDRVPAETEQPTADTAPSQEVTAAAEELSDTSFGREVDEFSADSTGGPIFESPQADVTEEIAPSQLFGVADVPVAEELTGQPQTAPEDEPADEEPVSGLPATTEASVSATAPLPPVVVAGDLLPADLDLEPDQTSISSAFAEDFATTVQDTLGLTAEAPIVSEPEPIEPPPDLAVGEESVQMFDDVELAIPAEDLTQDSDAAAEPPADSIPDLTDAAEEQALADRNPPHAPPQPPLIPGLPLFGAAVETPTFVGGLPLVLNELPAPPPTFGRVQVSFGNGVQPPRAVIDDGSRGPGPFDAVTVDYDDPMPPATDAITEVPPGFEQFLEEELDEPAAPVAADEAPAVAEELPADDELPPAEELSTADLPADELPTAEMAVEEFPIEEPTAADEFAADVHQAEEAVEERGADLTSEADEWIPEPEPQEAIEPVEAGPVAEAHEPAPAEEAEIESSVVEEELAPESPPPARPQMRIPPPPVQRPQAQPRGGRGAQPLSERAATEEAPPAGFEGASADAGFGQAPAQVFGGLTAPAHRADPFGQGFSADLSNDPFFGGAVKPAQAPQQEKPGGRKPRTPRAAPPPAAVDADVEAMAGKLADELGASPAGDLPARAPERLPAVRPQGRLAPQQQRPARAALAPPAAAADLATRPGLEPAPPPQPAGRANRVGVLFFVMLFLMALAFALVYTFMKQRVAVSGSISFENFTKLTVAQQRALQDRERARMVSEELRLVALNTFHVDHPGESPGFLGQPEDFARNETRVRWTDDGTLVYRLDDATRIDVDRLRAVLKGLYAIDDSMRHEADKSRQEINNLRRTVEQRQKDLDALGQRRKELTALTEAQMAPDQIAALTAEKEAAEQKWKQAVAAVNAAEAELKRLEQSSGLGIGATSGAGDASGKSDSLADTATVATAAADPELEALQRNLEQATARLNTIRNTAAEQAEVARKALDGALEKFQKDAESLQGIIKDNPELSAFLAAVQRLQQTTHKLSGDLLALHQKTYDGLLDRKRYLDERLANRRKELWDNDAQIARLKADLGMRERGYNAAVDNGYTREATEIKQQMDGQLAKIEQRKMELENDPILVTLNELAAKQQQEITASQKELEAARKQDEELAREMEKSFSQIAPAVERLPENQRKIAQQMTSRMDAVANARKAYAEALESKSAAANAPLQLVEDQVRTLTGRVEDRKKALAALGNQQLSIDDQNKRQAYLDQKRAAYDALKKSETDAYNRYFEKEKAARLASADIAAARKANEELTRVTADLFSLRDKELPVLTANLQQKEQLALGMAYPTPPKITEPQALADRRPLFAMGAMAAIALLFSLLFALTGGTGVARARIPTGDRYAQPTPPSAFPVAARAPLDPLTGTPLPRPGLIGAAAAEVGQPEEESAAV
jgi:pSer/pThr/pTyr-binding forkhead associated (FHA) protein